MTLTIPNVDFDTSGNFGTDSITDLIYLICLFWFQDYQTEHILNKIKSTNQWELH